MNLKTERERTKVLANKAKICLTNINGALNEAGVSEANTLQDVPSRIWGITANYRKFAKGECDINIPNNYNYVKYSIPLNLEFTPQNFYVEFEESEYHSNINDFMKTILEDGNYIEHPNFIDSIQTVISSQNAIINIKNSRSSNINFRIKKWIALE